MKHGITMGDELKEYNIKQMKQMWRWAVDFKNKKYKNDIIPCNIKPSRITNEIKWEYSIQHGA